MTRLIDADSAAKEISRFVGYLDDDTILRLQIALKRLPTIDAVPVVRCKDCKYASIYVCQGELYISCENNEGILSDVPSDGYCYCGEKVTE